MFSKPQLKKSPNAESTIFRITFTATGSYNRLIEAESEEAAREWALWAYDTKEVDNFDEGLSIDIEALQLAA